jgi:hypothetical protein
MPTPRKKFRKRKEKSGTLPTTPDNGGKRQYRKFSPTTKKLRDPLIEAAANEGIQIKRKNFDKNGKQRIVSKWIKDKVNEFAKRCQLLQIHIMTS